MVTINFDRDKVAKMLNTTHGFRIPASDGKVYRTVVKGQEMSDLWLRVAAEIDKIERKGGEPMNETKRIVRVVLDDMREWYDARPQPFRDDWGEYIDVGKIIDAYEKDRLDD